MQIASQNYVGAGATSSGSPSPHMQAGNGKYSNYCRDRPTAGSLRLFPGNGGSYQQWIPEPVAAGGNRIGYRQLKNVATGQCLDGNGSALYVQNCNSAFYQRWGR